MNYLKKYCAIFPLLLMFVLMSFVPAFAAVEQDAELDTRLVQYHATYYLNDDFTSYIETQISAKILTEAAIKQAKTRNFSYSTSIEAMDVIEAYTLKSTGEKVAVPKNNFQVKINKGNKEGGPVFSDRTTLTVVFPDVAVNDTVYIHYKLTQTEPMFPGHFTAQASYYHASAYDDVKVVLNIPDKLEYRFQNRQMSESISVQGQRKLIELTYKNTQPKKDTREDYSVWNIESEAGFALSTFKDYESIALAYGDRASPKAIPTDRVKRLAKEIVGKIKNDKAKAKALYDWVANNITYAGNCIGVGAVVPHDTDFILDNKMGDCKDHATLLQALLAAENIKSTQALVNSGSIYHLPTVPMVSSVNHVINYLPDFKQFVDATSHTTPFNMLPFAVSDKPVLLVDNYRKDLRTPRQSPKLNKQVMDTVVHIQEDGSIKGNIALALAGMPAAQARASWRRATKQQEQDWIEGVFAYQGSKGVGAIQKDDPLPLESEFNYTVDFEKKGFIQGSGAGAFHIAPLMPTPASIYGFIDFPTSEVKGHEVACGNGTSIETFEYHFPKTMTLLATPKDFEIKAHYLHFSATYKQKQNTLIVKRIMEDKTPGHVCSAELMNLQRGVLIKIAQSLESQVVYQR